jgi:hypothetical protein
VPAYIAGLSPQFPQHEMYFYREIRRRYMDHMIFLGVPLADRSSPDMAVGEKHRRGEMALLVLHSLLASTAGELLNEVMAKLLAVGSSGAHEPRLGSHHG